MEPVVHEVSRQEASEPRGQRRRLQVQQTILVKPQVAGHLEPSC